MGKSVSLFKFMNSAKYSVSFNALIKHSPVDIMADENIQNELIDFMFLRDENGALDVMKCLGLWFGKSNDTDAEICTRFGSYVESALAANLDRWLNTPRGCLALMILIDQFPRNVYRHTVRAFDGALASRKLVEIGHDWLKVLRPEHCIFVPCLILTHQESVPHQRACLDFYEKLEPLLPSELLIFRTIFVEHLRIVEICGHFPHRDHYYGRVTTDIGKALMENSKVRFDLPLICENGVVRFGHDAKKLWRTTQIAFDILERIDALVDKTVQQRRNSVLSAATTTLTTQQIAEHKEIFGHFDHDGSGYLEIQEFASVLSSSGRQYDNTRLQAAIDCITGQTGSKTVTFQQFTTLLSIDMTSSWEERVEKRFHMFDTDDSGNISIEELIACIRSLDELITVEDIGMMMHKCDVNSDGSISLDEFREMVPHLANATEKTRRESAVAGYDPSKNMAKSAVTKPSVPVFDPTWSLVHNNKITSDVKITVMDDANINLIH